MRKLTVFLLWVVGTLMTVSTQAQNIENIARENPFEIHGTASASVGYYNSSAFNSSRKPYSYSIMLAPTLAVYGVQIPFNFTFTEGSSNVKNPFAQLGINPYYKWAKGYFGWTNMTWSPTTLNGKTFLGAGIEINPSLFRFGAFYGRMNPALQENLLIKNSQLPQYKRRGWGLKLGVGNEDNHVDFIWLHSKDVVGSIPAPVDPLNKLDFTPQENAVFGIKSHQAIFKKKLTWDMDGAVSAITRDLNSSLLDIGTGIGTKFLRVAIPPRLSTSYAWTVHTNLLYRAENYSLGFDYNRIQPEYQSHGLDYILNDQQKISLIQTFVAAKKKVNVNLNEFYQHDNLNKRKSAKTNRTGLSASVALNLNQHFGAAISYSNYITFQSKGSKELNDTTRLFQIQQTILFAPRYTVFNTKMVHNVFLSASYSRMDDLNNFTAQYTRNNTVNTNIGYSLSLNSLMLNLAPSFNVLYTQTSSFNMLSIGPTLAISKNFLKGALGVNTAITFTASRQNGLWTSKTVNNNIGLSYHITPNHSVKLGNNIMYTFYTLSNSHEYKGEVTYTYTFDYAVKNKKTQNIY